MQADIRDHAGCGITTHDAPNIQGQGFAKGSLERMITSVHGKAIMSRMAWRQAPM
jgi:hypothetical protein